MHLARLKTTPELEKKYTLIREDFKNQLLELNKLGNQYDDLLEHIMYLIKLKDVLQADIDKKGIRLKVQTGNGFKKEEDNKSVDKLLKVSAQLFKSMDDLDLKDPPIKPADSGGEPSESLL
jgi:hypothetical protein